ncbi:MAG: FAD-dependent oxidoreductase [Pseudomonadota bacterium]
MKIAIVGGGISGMGAALALEGTHDVTLFEAEERLGGHAHTVEACFGETRVPVDLGFIVFNERNYPNLCGMFEHLGVPSKWSDMSFGFSLKGGRHEYACESLDKLFAQRSRIFDPRHIAGLREIQRFLRIAPDALAEGRLQGLTLGEWLDEQRFSTWFRDRFLLPMGGAIWSTRTHDVLDFPAENFVAFFVNHDLMTGLAPAQRWRTVDGGSREYVRRVGALLGERAVTGRRVVAARPAALGRPAALRFADGGVVEADALILACHGPQALALLRAGGSDALDQEVEATLDRFRTSTNRAVLHSDPSLLPRRRKVWSSWNFLSEGADVDAKRPAAVSYWMNRLQGIPEEHLLVVSLNPGREPDPALVHAEKSWAHPLFDAGAFDAQSALERVQGRGGVWFAGAWLGYGFHEDGLTAGLRVAEALGGRPVWARGKASPIERAEPVAAE